jgi:hypothetical protein
MIGDSDRCIGATALHHHLPLLTNHRRHFELIEKVRLMSFRGCLERRILGAEPFRRMIHPVMGGRDSSASPAPCVYQCVV